MESFFLNQAMRDSPVNNDMDEPVYYPKNSTYLELFKKYGINYGEYYENGFKAHIWGKIVSLNRCNTPEINRVIDMFDMSIGGIND